MWISKAKKEDCKNGNWRITGSRQGWKYKTMNPESQAKLESSSKYSRFLFPEIATFSVIRFKINADLKMK